LSELTLDGKPFRQRGGQAGKIVSRQARLGE